MKVSEIKKSVTVALMTGVATSAKAKRPSLVKESDVFTDDIRMQCQAVGDHLATKFLQECMRDAEKCLKDGKRFDELMKEFEKIGPRFSMEIEE